jgi:hypothetical protein
VWLDGGADCHHRRQRHRDRAPRQRVRDGGCRGRHGHPVEPLGRRPTAATSTGSVFDVLGERLALAG